MAETQSLRKLVVGTAGHIDHGKSALINNLTGHDPDRLPEEQERNLTIDIGFSEYRLSDGYEVGIIDVPGHEKFIKNMVAGAAAIDFVVFVVAADDGVMPQTREHLTILENLDVSRGICVITKTDLVEPILVEVVEEELEELFRDTFMEDAPVCPVSNTEQTGLETFQETFDRYIRESPEKEGKGIFRMPIQRVFTLQGIGTIVTGVPVSGSISLEDDVEIQPAGKAGRVRGIQAHNRDLDQAQSGHRTALNLADVHHDQIARGDVVSDPNYLEPVQILEAQFHYDSPHDQPIEHWDPIRLHIGSREELGRIRVLNQKQIHPGEKAFVQFELEHPLVAVPGDPFILRQQSPMITLGGGYILNTSDQHMKRWNTSNEKRLAQRRDVIHNREQFVEYTARSQGASSFSLRELARSCFVPEESISRSFLRPLPGTDKFVHPDGLTRARKLIQTALKQFHKEYPELIGLPKYKLQERIGRIDPGDHLSEPDEEDTPFPGLTSGNNTCSPDVFQCALQQLQEEQTVEIHDDLIALQSHQPRLTDQQKTIRRNILEQLEDQPFHPPRTQEIHEYFSDQDHSNVDRVLQHLKQAGTMVELQDDLCFLQETLQDARHQMTERIQSEGYIETGEFRDLLDTSRKYAIPILEYFDQQGITYRKGSKRYLQQN